MARTAPSNEETKLRIGEITRESAALKYKMEREERPQARLELEDRYRALSKERHVLQMRVRTRAARSVLEELSRPNPTFEWSKWLVVHAPTVAGLTLLNEPEKLLFSTIEHSTAEAISAEEVKAARIAFKKSMEDLAEKHVERQVEAYAQKLPAYAGKRIECPSCGCKDARLIHVRKQEAEQKRRLRLLAAAKLAAAESSYVNVLRMFENGEETVDGLQSVTKYAGMKAKTVYRAHFLRIFLNSMVARCEYADVNTAQKRGPKAQPRPGYCLLIPMDEGSKCERWHAGHTARSKKEVLAWAHRQVIKGYRSQKDLLADLISP